jgi:hypothetical protein
VALVVPDRRAAKRRLLRGGQLLGVQGDHDLTLRHRSEVPWLDSIRECGRLESRKRWRRSSAVRVFCTIGTVTFHPLVYRRRDEW